MAVLKTYSLTPSQLNSDKLHTEIAASGFVDEFKGLEISGNLIKVHGTSLTNETALDTLVSNHEVESLQDLKDKRYFEIDDKTQDLIVAGFTFDGQTFSLSLPAQSNWNAIHDNLSEFTFPLAISTLDNNEYSLTALNVNPFWTAGKNILKGHLDSGRSLKKQIFDAADKTTVNSIQDNR